MSGGTAARRFRNAYVACLTLLVVLPSARPRSTGRSIRTPTTASGIRSIVPTSMDEEGGGPQSPFFPSSAKTNVGGIIPSNFFMDSEACGRCHKDIYEQWKSSMHHFGSFNNQFYRKAIEYMQSVVGTQPSKWCAGCHDHAVFFNGRFDRPIKEQIDTPEARAGLSCTSCHAITHVDSSMGNAGFTIEYPPLHELLSSKNKFIQDADYFMTYLNPEPHRAHFHEAVHAPGCRGILLGVPQGAPGCAGQQIPLVPRIQRVRQLAGQRGLRAWRAVVLLSETEPELRGLPHADGGFGTIRATSTEKSIRIASRAPIRPYRMPTRIRSSWS